MNEANKVAMHKVICHDLNNLYYRKNHDYGDAFGQSFDEWSERMKSANINGGLVMACIRLGDKLNRLKSLSSGTTAQVAESVEDTLLDMANYAIMTVIEMRKDVPQTEELMKLLKETESQLFAVPNLLDEEGKQILV